MQWPWGTVSALGGPVDRRLTEFEVPDGALFRMHVVQPPGPERHKLLGDLLSGFEPFAVLDTPFAEALQACFTKFYSSVGVGNLRNERFTHLIPKT